MAFVQRQIQVSFNMASGNFQGGGNVVNFQAIQQGPLAPNQGDPNIPRITASIEAAGGVAAISASVAIYGMPLSTMNQLSVSGTQFQYQNQNSITISAGDTQTGLNVVFSGIITWSAVDAQSQPQVCFRVEARPDAAVNAKNAKPTSTQGAADVGQLFGKLAQAGGFQFQNYGVSTQLRNPYLWGSIGNQIRQLGHAAGSEFIIDRGTLSIWQPNQSNSSGSIDVRPPKMVGYPVFSQAFITVRTLFDPTVTNPMTMNVTSDLTPACGQWKIVKIMHEIESNMPQGKWFTSLTGGPLGADTPSN